MDDTPYTPTHGLCDLSDDGWATGALAAAGMLHSTGERPWSPALGTAVKSCRKQRTQKLLFQRNRKSMERVNGFLHFEQEIQIPGKEAELWGERTRNPRSL